MSSLITFYLIFVVFVVVEKEAHRAQAILEFTTLSRKTFSSSCLCKNVPCAWFYTVPESTIDLVHDKHTSNKMNCLPNSYLSQIRNLVLSNEADGWPVSARVPLVAILRLRLLKCATEPSFLHVCLIHVPMLV